MRIVFTGSRDWTDYDLVEEKILELCPSGSILVNGQARGLDTIVDTISTRHYYTTIRYPAEWDKYGKKAGPMRNKDMIMLPTDLLIGFHENLESSKGTKHMIGISVYNNIPTVVFDAQGNIIRDTR